MGRRLNISQPAVIQTELRPLDESFWIDANGSLEQWYYVNNSAFAPDRQITPLILSPALSVVDHDSETTYTPQFSIDRWEVKEYVNGAWVTTTITSQTQSDNYVVQGLNLLVRKNNYDAAHAITVTCYAKYNDPRDVGAQYWVQESLMLTTNTDATQAYPDIEILESATRTYNPLKDESSIFGFEAQADWSAIDVQSTDVTEYKVDVDGTEEILNSGEAVAPIMDIRYGDTRLTDQEFMYRQTAGGTLVGESINNAYIERIKGNTVAWNQAVLQNVSISPSQGSAVNDKWSSFDSNTTLTANGRELQILKSGGYGIARYGLRSGTIVSGHVYYLGVDIKTTASAGMITVSGYAVDNVIDSGRTQTETTNWQRICSIRRCDTAERQEYRITDTRSSNFDTVYAKGFMFIDLTLIYGEGNEPTTVEEFEADYERWFGKPLTYEEYDEGSLRPVLMSGIKTTGFNQWDEEWEAVGSRVYTKNFIRVIHGCSYYLKIGNIPSGTQFALYHYDNDKKLVNTTYPAVSSVITIPSDVSHVKMLFPSAYGASYNHDICINISNPSKNGTYEPYEGHIASIPVTSAKGRLLDASGNPTGSAVTVFPDGLKKAGNIQDEIFVENGVIKAIKRVGSVDFGSLNWNKNDSRFATTSIQNLMSYPQTSNAAGNIIHPKYLTHSYSGADNLDNIIYTSWKDAGVKALWVKDSSYTDAETFKTAMQGVMLYYELATPETYILDDTFKGQFVWYGVDGSGNEVPIDTLPVYTQATQPTGYGQGTNKININALYGENIAVILRVKRYPWDNTVLPPKVTKSVVWKIPPVDIITTCDQGSAVRATSPANYVFGTIVNQQGEVISDAKKSANMQFDWYLVKEGTTGSTTTSKGSGLTKTIAASELRNILPVGGAPSSSRVYCEAYVLGAYHLVNGQYVRTKD